MLQIDNKSAATIVTVAFEVNLGHTVNRGKLQEVIDLYKKFQIPVPYVAYRRAYVDGYDVEGLTIRHH